MLHHYSIHAIIKATGCILLCNSSKYEPVTTGKSDLPLSCEPMESKVSAFGTAAGIFGSLWAEVVATIQNPLNATTATARGLWDRTILLSKGIRAHTTWPLSFCVCVCVTNDQITLYRYSHPGFTETVRTAEVETSNGQ